MLTAFVCMGPHCVVPQEWYDWGSSSFSSDGGPVTMDGSPAHGRLLQPPTQANLPNSRLNKQQSMLAADVTDLHAFDNALDVIPQGADPEAGVEASHVVLKEGYLIKKGARVKNWKKRWFVLNGDALRYYNDRVDGPSEERGSVFLGDVTKVLHEPRADTFADFLVGTNFGRVYEMKCPNGDGERDAWTRAISDAIEARRWETQAAADVTAAAAATPLPGSFAAGDEVAGAAGGYGAIPAAAAAEPELPASAESAVRLAIDTDKTPPRTPSRGRRGQDMGRFAPGSPSLNVVEGIYADLRSTGQKSGPIRPYRLPVMGEDDLEPLVDAVPAWLRKDKMRFHNPWWRQEPAKLAKWIGCTFTFLSCTIIVMNLVFAALDKSIS